MGFGYNTIDFDQIESVEIVSRREGYEDQEFDDQGGELTKGQRQKRQLVNYLEEDFENFHTFFDRLLACYSESGVDRDRISQLVGAPDFVACENCSNCRETMDETLICSATGENRDGTTYYKVLEDTGTIPTFCTPDMRFLEFPSDQIEDVDEDLVSIAYEGYREYLINERERCERRREEAIESGNEDSAYVTKDIEEFLDSREEYISRNLSKYLRGLFSPNGFNRFRNSAMRIAWFLHLDDALEDDYYPQKAEAFLRALDSPYKTDVQPGIGGLKFEEEVREFVREIGWPLRERRFRIYGETDTNHKEMDIHTSIADIPTVIEVYTSGSHNDKKIQAGDYQDLYELAKGQRPNVVHLTDDTAAEKQISLTFFETILDHEPVSVESVPGDYREYQTEKRDMTPGKIGCVDGFRYEFPEMETEVGMRTKTWGGFEYKPSSKCVEVESWVEDRLQECSLDVTKPYSKPQHWAYAVGPTTTFTNDESELLVAFHGGRDQQEIVQDAGQSTTIRSPNNWPYWLAETHGCRNVAVIEVIDDDDIQNILTPRLLHTLLQLERTGT